MKRIYIAGPISKGDLATNIWQADCAMLALMRAGLAPFNPMLSCYAGGVSIDRVTGMVVTRADAKAHAGFREMTVEQWYAMDRAWVRASDAVLRLSGESVGADLECEQARKLGIPVFTVLSTCIAWATCDLAFTDLGLAD